MIIIIGMLFLLTIPFYIYWGCIESPIKKHMFIMLETVAIGVLIFSSVLVVLDIPYIIKGGQLYEGEPLYYMGKNIIGNDDDTYWVTDDLYGEEFNNAKVYVLPHTHLVYKIEGNDLADILLNRDTYHIKNFSMNTAVLAACAIAFLAMTIKSWYKWS